MAFKVTVDAAGTHAMLQGMAARAHDLKKPMRAFGEFMVRRTTQRIEGQPDFWPPLADSTRAKKKGRLILVGKGRLLRSITYLAGSRELEIGSNVIYARIHQLGGMAGRGRRVRIPARPYLWFEEEDLKELQETIADYLEGKEV